MVGGDTAEAVPRAVSLLWGALPVSAPTLAFTTGVEPNAFCVVLTSPASWDLPSPGCTAAFSGGSDVTGPGVFPEVVLGKGLAVASGAEWLFLGASKSAWGPVSEASVPWGAGSGVGLVLTITWLGSAPTASVSGFFSMSTSNDSVPTACPPVLPSRRGSPEASVGGEMARDSRDIPTAVSWGMLNEDTLTIIPAVTLPSRRGETSASDATGILAGAALGDCASAPEGASSCSAAWGSRAGRGPGVTPVPEGAEAAAGPGWLWLGNASGTARVAVVSHSVVVVLPLASDAVPIPTSLSGGSLTREGGWAAGSDLMPYILRDVGAAVT